VRLKHAYIVKCESYTKDESGRVTEIRCTYVPESKSGNDTSGINVKGTLHWVATHAAVPVEVRLYDRLFRVEDPSSEEGDFKDYINPESLNVISAAMAEPTVALANAGDKFQFLRKGYFCADKNSVSGKPVFNRTVTLKDTWAKEEKKGA
jgi:glutaminyl-tRNA synthetase